MKTDDLMVYFGFYPYKLEKKKRDIRSLNERTGTDFTTQSFQRLRPSKDFSIWLHSYIFVYSTDILGLSSVTPCESECWYVGQDRAC